MSDPVGQRQALEGEWLAAAGRLEEGCERGYHTPGFDDSSWEILSRPGLRGVTAGQDTVWYRHRFQAAPSPDGQRLLLRFGGAFYFTRAWLNGIPLGEHEGYFQPFGFDLTGRIQLGENLLAVACRTPVEAGDFKRKTAVAGVFTDWDCKPYPSAVYPELPEPYQWTVPAGLWRPVELLACGPVVVESFNVFPTHISLNGADAERAGSAEVRAVVGLRNLTREAQSARLRIDINPDHFEAQGDGAGFEPLEGTVELEPGARRRATFDLRLERPRLWWPWTHGEARLYRARLALEGGGVVERPFGVRQVQVEMGAGGWAWRLNGRRIFPKGSNYTADFFLDRVTHESLRRDVELARGANLDLLRVHAHIAPPEFYQLCDQLGMLVWCDFPLIWTYAYDLPEKEAARFRDSVLEQAGQMVDLLGSHASIVLWSLHNEPPWTHAGHFLGSDLHHSGTNREVDREAAERVRVLDPSRPAIPGSGEHDQHLYHGWYTGTWSDNRDLEPGFPTEFGVQALPSRDSPFWETVNTGWPVDPDDATWAHAGYQSIFWASPGVGLPAHYPSLEDYIAESQAYQAFYIRYTIDQWRRRKFAPTGGFIHFLFTDCWPAITWSVLDYDRQPKAGYRALAEASRPVRLALDLQNGFRVEHAFHLVYPQGGRFKAGLWLVNDDYRQAGRVEVLWWLEREDEGRLRRAVGRALRRRLITAPLPGADEGARLVKEVHLTLSFPGDYIFHTQVRQGGRVLDENSIPFRVGRRRRARKVARRIPRFLVNKVYRPGSLASSGDGFRFRLLNPTLPVSLQRLQELRVDGAPIDLRQVELLIGDEVRQAASVTPQAPFEIQSRRDVEVVVRGYPLSPGRHVLEVTIQLKGFGKITAQIWV